MGWCRLRSISVHPELAQFAVCHHWTHQAPRLPRLDENSTRPPMDRQLELGRSLVGSVAGDL
ncbi:MAG: hypothetical protein GY914_12030 [Prochlorococcus sp.]|nr:hypothetical protein [Prochlorococcus sp.]